MIRRLIPTFAVCLLATACVWPVPRPGEPVPTIELDTTWAPVDGTITIDVHTSHLDPTVVRLYPSGINAASIADDTAPFSFVLDVADFAPGVHAMPVLATDGVTVVLEVENVRIDGCNGHHALCGRSYADTSVLTAHNAMSSAADGWIGPNQNLDVPSQLDAGVRGLMLDTYRAGDLNAFGLPQVPGVDPDSAYLCHALCALGKQPLAEGLGEIRAFLDENPGEVVTLIFESYLDHDLTAAAFDEAGLTPYAYTHPGGAWPTLGTMIDAGTRLAVLQDVDVDPTHPWLMDVWDHAFETHFSASAPEDFSCAHLRGSPSNDLFILNHFLTEVFGSPELADMVNHNPFLLDRALECQSFHATTANFVTVDFVDIGDGRNAVDALNGV